MSKNHNKQGRPTVMTPEKMVLLRHAFDLGATDEEACISAQISTSTLYSYQLDNPDFLEEKEARKFYYRCDYEKCSFRSKSKERFRHHVRAKVIVDFVIDFLRKNDLATKEIYDHYVDDAKKVQKEKLHFLKHEKKSIIEKIKRLDNKIKKIKEYLLDADEDLKEDYENDFKSAKTQLKETKALSKKINEKIEENKVLLLTFSKFTEQVRKIPDEIEKTKVLKRKDYLIQKIFSNIAIKDKKVALYQLNKPFSTFEKKAFLRNVGVAGLEPATSPSRTVRATNCATPR